MSHSGAPLKEPFFNGTQHIHNVAQHPLEPSSKTFLSPPEETPPTQEAGGPCSPPPAPDYRQAACRLHNGFASSRRFMQLESYSVWSLVLGFFCSACVRVPSMARPGPYICSFSWLSNISLCGQTTFCLSGHLSVGTCVLSTSLVAVSVRVDGLVYGLLIVPIHR